MSIAGAVSKSTDDTPYDKSDGSYNCNIRVLRLQIQSTQTVVLMRISQNTYNTYKGNLLTHLTNSMPCRETLWGPPHYYHNRKRPKHSIDLLYDSGISILKSQIFETACSVFNAHYNTLQLRVK